MLILIIISQFSVIFTSASFTHTTSNFHITTVRCLPLNLPVTFWIWGRPSIFLPDGKSPCTFIFEICGLLVIYFLGGNDCSRLLYCCCCFLITPWLSFWWWVWIAGMSCERSASMSSLLSQVSSVSLLQCCCCFCCCCCCCFL